jgi:hypothetical protein
MAGDVGLPSLEKQARGRGKHVLSKVLSSGGDAEDDETFGYLESGFRALGLELHAFDTYRAFLEAHAGHRLFLWADEEDSATLPPELRDRDSFKWLKYQEPSRKGGYVKRGLAISCRKCDDEFESDSTDWVKPFKARPLEKEEIQLFGRVAAACECAVHEAEPFDLLVQDLGEWLSEHKAHRPTIKLTSDET